jgi:hypothetical protein
MRKVPKRARHARTVYRFGGLKENKGYAIFFQVVYHGGLDRRDAQNLRDGDDSSEVSELVVIHIEMPFLLNIRWSTQPPRVFCAGDFAIGRLSFVACWGLLLGISFYRACVCLCKVSARVDVSHPK